MNSRCNQFGPQIITQQILFGLVKCFAESLGFDFQGKPGVITTSDVFALMILLCGIGGTLIGLSGLLVRDIRNVDDIMPDFDTKPKINLEDSEE